MPGSLTIARIFGIQVRVHSSWLFVFILVLLTFHTVFAENPFWTEGQRWLAAGITTFLFFLSVLVHELSHSLVARRFSLPVHSITLFVFGGVANLRREPDDARAEFLMAAVGPATSFALGGLAWVLLTASDAFLAPGRVRAIAVSIFEQIAAINVILAVFNLLPGFPLDGGRVLRSIIWGLRRDRRLATRVATWGGQLLAGALALWGVFQLIDRQFVGGSWSMLIAFFLYNAATASYQQEVFGESLRRLDVGTLMTRELTSVPPDLPIDALVATYVLPLRGRAFPVVADGRLVGLISVANVRRLPQEEWPRRRVSDVMTPLERLEPLSPSDDARRGLERLLRDDVSHVPVVAGGEIVGLFERDAVFEYLRMREELGLDRQRRQPLG